MLKTSGSTKFKSRSAEGGVRVGSSRAKHLGSKLNKTKVNGGEVDGGKINDEIGKKG